MTTASVMRLCEIPDCGRKHYGRGLCREHWIASRRGPTCGAETFGGQARRRCTRPARAVRDGLLVCHQHGELELVRWAGAMVRIRERLSRPAIASVPRIAARIVEEAAEQPAANTAPSAVPTHGSGGRPTLFDTEVIAAEIERDGIWPVIARHEISYQHAVRIRGGWRPQALRSGRIEARSPA